MSSITATVATLVAQAERQDAQITADLLAATRAALEQRERLNRALLHGLRHALHAGEIGLTAQSPPALPLPPALVSVGAALDTFLESQGLPPTTPMRPARCVVQAVLEPTPHETPVEAATAPPASPPPVPVRTPTPPPTRPQRPVEPPAPAAIVLPEESVVETGPDDMPDPGPTTPVRVPAIRGAYSADAARSARRWPGYASQQKTLEPLIEDISSRLAEVEALRVAGDVPGLRALQAAKTTAVRPGLARRIEEALAGLLTPIPLPAPAPVAVEPAPESTEPLELVGLDGDEGTVTQDSPSEAGIVVVLGDFPA